MPRADHWSQLKVGILVFCGIVAVVAAVLLFARIGALHGKTTRLYLVTDKASGVMDGTEVRLAGQKVGLVRSVELRPPSTDTTERISIAMDVLNRYLPYIRRNSHAQIRPGGRLIGSPVIYITMGTAAAAAIAEDDTLRARPQAEAHSSIADASSLGDSLVEIAGTVSKIKSEFDTTLRDVAAIRRVSEHQAEAVHVALDNFTDRALASRGTIASIIRDSATLRKRTQHLSALADSIGTAATNGSGELGRFRRDSALVVEARRTRASVTQLRASIGRYTGRSADGAELARQLDLANAKLDSLVQDAKRHPLRYVAF
jgi:phospholipid/cholesterol/gamma-HCH transport system substrate-binding protein